MINKKGNVHLKSTQNGHFLTFFKKTEIFFKKSLTSDIFSDIMYIVELSDTQYTP